MDQNYDNCFPLRLFYDNIQYMQFEWHEAKRQTNIRKHGIDFVDVIRLFDGEAMLLEYSRFSYDEDRFWLVGFLGNVLVIVTYTVCCTQHSLCNDLP